MYFPIGWPKQLSGLKQDCGEIKHIICNRDRILFAVITANSIGIWFCKPCVLILNHQRSSHSLSTFGTNRLAEWRLDSTMLAVATSRNFIIFYHLDIDTSKYKSLYEQRDSKIPSLRRETAELFIKESIPPLTFVEAFSTGISGGITSLACIRDELMIPTKSGHIERLRWDGNPNADYGFNLSTIPFSIDQQHSRAVAVEELGVHINGIEYSPILGGFAIVLSDGRAAFLTATSLKFEANQIQGIWAQELQDATCAAVNHKYRLIAFGRKNAQLIVYGIDEMTGALQISQKLELSSKDYPDAGNALGAVTIIKWTPDGCAVAVSWEKGGLSLWTVFGALLMCSLGWDYGTNQAIMRQNFFKMPISTMEWGAEGYQLWIGLKNLSESNGDDDSNKKKWNSSSRILQMQFVKSALTVNPCMSNQEHLFLQGEDRLYINAGDAVVKMYKFHSEFSGYDDELGIEDVGSFKSSPSALIGNKQWIIVPIPYSYTGSNWPIRYTALSHNGQSVAVAGRTGVAHYCLQTRRWKLFGNETQEKDFVVTGGLMWWHDYLILGCYNILDDRDEIRMYPKFCKLDNIFVNIMKVPAQVLMINQFRDKLIIFCADSHISLYSLVQKETQTTHALKLQDIDISSLCIHPACVVSIALTSLRTESAHHTSKDAESILINVCGKLIMIQRDTSHSAEVDNCHIAHFSNPTILASCVENVWVTTRISKEKQHLMEALWLGCGSHGLKVWLPLFPQDGDKPHNFMSRRIMLPFHAHIYPLAVLFEDAVILGAENDTILYPNDQTNPYSSLPFCVIERTSQVYLHHILRQLLRRNLGFHAWEIARSCANLPYFPHSLELLLHEVLDEEATSKEPIPDALLPRVIEFIREFPVYLQTVVQCARKTEIALWQYLFAAVGNPKDLFQECLEKKQLEAAASYLIILQNLEPATVSRQHATILLDAALEYCKWELSKDLVRFLRAIDPSDVESPPRSAFYTPTPVKYSVTLPASPLSPSEEEFSYVLGTMQVPRGRTHSVTSTKPLTDGSLVQHKELSRSTSDPKPIPLRKKSQTKEGETAEEFFIDVILHRHTRKLLAACRLRDLGNFAAHLDIHLVSWLKKERNRAGKVEDFVMTLKKLHQDFSWPYPIPPHPASYYLERKSSGSSLKSGASSLSPLEEKMKSLAIDINSTQSPAVQIGDSGYLSNPGPQIRSYTYPQLDVVANQTVEAFLRPHIPRDENSLHTVDLSEESSSFWGEGDYNYIDDTMWANIQLTSNLEQLSQELSSKGPQQSEIQLRYLLQIMLEAGCLEWALLISVVLRDAMSVIRTINASRMPDIPQDVPIRLKEGLSVLDHWTDTECLGYKPFMQAIYNQMSVLAKIIHSKPKMRHSSLTDLMVLEEACPITEEVKFSRSRTSSGSIAENQIIETKDTDTVSSKTPVFGETKVEEPSNQQQMECAVS